MYHLICDKKSDEEKTRSKLDWAHLVDGLGDGIVMQGGLALVSSHAALLVPTKWHGVIHSARGVDKYRASLQYCCLV